MAKILSMLLMLVMLGVFIHSSQAVKCYDCQACEEPSGECHDEVCVKQATGPEGMYFSIYVDDDDDDDACYDLICT